MKTRRTMKQAQALATQKGLSVDGYNPGDGMRYKVDEGINKSFMEMSINSLHYCKTLDSVFKFLNNYEKVGEVTMKPKYQNYRVCYENGDKTKAKIYELHKSCECSNCEYKLKSKRHLPNSATATTRDISKIDEVAEFLSTWNCKDNKGKQPSSTASIGKEPYHVVATITYFQF